MIAVRLYRLALGAFPKRHRDLYAAEMADAFTRQLQAARSAGRWPSLRFLIAAVCDAIAMGMRERRRHHVVRAGYFFSALDFTLAWRVLLRYPGLSIISVFGMAVGIAIAAGGFTVMSAMMSAALPLPGGDRIVSLITRDVTTNNVEPHVAHDYGWWRSLQSLEELGIWRQNQRNLIVEGRQPETVTIAEVTAAAFRIAGVQAIRGRHLLSEDEAADAPGAMVIGYDEWVTRFDGDPDIVGRRVQLGSVDYAIVGVMPRDFGFPINHTFWVPWRVDPAVIAPRTGPLVRVFGRLAPGASLESAQAELSAIERQIAAASPRTHEHLRTRVAPYTFAFNDMGDPDNYMAMYAIQLAIVLLLVLVAVNVAILVYARTATRDGEIAVRAALGASRFRIVSQLFVEALTLSGVAAAAGILIVTVALPFLEGAALSVVGGRMPFWLDFQLSPDVLLYLVVLTLLCAAIVGVLPALKVTKRDVNARLQTLSPGSGSRMRMGRLWTLLIVMQVALTVAILPAAMFYTWDGLRLRTGDSGFASHEFLSATLSLYRSAEPITPAAAAAFRGRYKATYEQLEQRLRGEAAVRDVTFSQVDAGQELAMVIEAEGETPPAEPANYNIVAGSKTGVLARYNKVAGNFFDAFAVPVILGRGFTRADEGTDRVLVNRTFAERVFGDANPLGRRFKYVGRSREAGSDAMPMGEWYEIVGVVPDFPVNMLELERRIYHAAAIDDVFPARLGVRVRGSDPAAFAGKLRDLSALANPDLQVGGISTVEMVVKREQGMFRLIGVSVGLVMLSVITLSAAGIYALMSFTVSRRRREIGIRAALGADRRRLLAGLFSRVAAQLATGAGLGAIGALGIGNILEGEMMEDRFVVILPLVAVVMTVVGLLAAVGPARQGLSIQPTEALRED